MPLFNPSDDVIELPTVVPVPAITAPSATTPVYSTQASKHTQLITDIEGEPWTLLGYYKQLLSSTEAPRILDLGLDPTVQQYLLVTGFRLSVTENLSSTMDTESGTMVISGEGLVYPETIIPNVGDMFVGKVELGAPVIFTVAQVTRLSFYARSVYRVEYRVFSDYAADVVADLTAKVSETRYFDNKRLITGNSPIVTYDAINREELYRRAISGGMDLLYNRFWDTVSHTFIFTQGSDRVYDPWAINFFNVVLGRFCRKNRAMPTEYACGDTRDLMLRPTVWRMIKNADDYGINYLYPRAFTLTSIAALAKVNKYHSIVHVGVDKVPMPDSWNTNTIDTTVPAYVLSHAFYTKDVDVMTLEEKVVLSCIRGETVSNLNIDALIERLPTLADGEQFYAILLLTAVLKIKLGET